MEGAVPPVWLRGVSTFSDILFKGEGKPHPDLADDKLLLGDVLCNLELWICFARASLALAGSSVFLLFDLFGRLNPSDRLNLSPS